MIDFGKFPTDQTLLGKVLRFPLKLAPTNIPLPILQGPLRGTKWFVSSGIKAFWLGSHEADLQRVMVQTVEPKNVFYDIGANVGFFTLLGSRLVGPSGRVVAFEPLPVNLRYIRSHVTFNHLANVQIIEAAVSDDDGVGHFFCADDSDSSIGKLSDEGIAVRISTIDGLIEGGTIPPPDCIKMDIEGTEAKALAGAEKCLKTHRPVIFLATHGQEVHEQCCELLTSWGFNLQILAAMPNHRWNLLARHFTG